MKGRQFNSKSLSATDGVLNMRVDTLMNHMPVPPPGKTTRCQLHVWAQREKCHGANMPPPPGARGKHVMHCEACNVNVCLPCWELFHEEKCLETKLDAIFGIK